MAGAALLNGAALLYGGGTGCSTRRWLRRLVCCSTRRLRWRLLYSTQVAGAALRPGMLYSEAAAAEPTVGAGAAPVNGCCGGCSTRCWQRRGRMPPRGLLYWTEAAGLLFSAMVQLAALLDGDGCGCSTQRGGGGAALLDNDGCSTGQRRRLDSDGCSTRQRHWTRADPTSRDQTLQKIGGQVAHHSRA